MTLKPALRLRNPGLVAEYLVLFYYAIRMYKLLHHRYKTTVGEIDLIMLKGKQLVFIEVKSRKYGMHENIVSANQQQRIARAAELFIAKNYQYSNYNIRFDLAVVRPYRLPLIIENAWYI
ncbi:MAG: YraN family protein [Rickettsiaceae bacterium]